MENTCVCCGAVIPEGRQACDACWSRAYDPAEFFSAERTPKEIVMETIESRDKKLEELWDDFANVAFDEDDDGRLILSEQWRCFEAGTQREDIWHWFDERYSKGVYALLY